MCAHPETLRASPSSDRASARLSRWRWETNADFLLIDETAGCRTAVQNGVPVKGTLGMLEEAANRNLVDLPEDG